MKKSKKKKSLASRILGIVGVLFLIIAVAATTAANVFSGVLDKYVGVGEAKGQWGQVQLSQHLSLLSHFFDLAH